MVMNDYNDADQERERKQLGMSRRKYDEVKFGTIADKRGILEIAKPLVAAIVERCARVADRKASLFRAKSAPAKANLAEEIAAEIRTLGE